MRSRFCPCRESAKVKFKTVPAIQEAAVVSHKGLYSTIRDSYKALFSWLDKSGYWQNGMPRESYLDGILNKESEAEWLTEIQVPVEKKESHK